MLNDHHPAQADYEGEFDQVIGRHRPKSRDKAPEAQWQNSSRGATASHRLPQPAPCSTGLARNQQ